MSDRAITADLMARLERHYIKPGAPLAGGVFLPEVGWNGGTAASRCDAIYVGFTGSSGRLLVGHEVKASRSDWLAELAKPGKADAWADECHEWWLVTAPGVVAAGELPAGWGHMVPGTSTTRMRVLVPARRHVDRVPSWDATRSIIARQDTLRAKAVEEGVRRVRAADEARIEESVEARLRYRSVPDATELQERLSRIERALGGRIVEGAAGELHWRDGERATEGDLADVASLLRTHGDLQDAAQALVGRYSGHEFTALRRSLDELDTARAAAIASITKPLELADVPA